MNVKPYFQPIKLTRLALLILITIILQLAASLLPILGWLFGVLTTLPILVAARLGPTPGGIAYLASGVLIFFFSPPTALLFWLGPGLGGITLGLGDYYQWEDLQLIFYSGLILAGGIYLLVTPFNSFVFANNILGTSLIIKLSFILPFSLGYICIWKYIFPIIVKAYTLLVKSNSSLIK